MKFLHTADLHEGLRQYGRRERELDFYAVLEQIRNIAVAETVDAVVLAGDIFDTVKPCDDAVCAVQEFVRSLSVPVFGIAGNHDACGNGWLTVCGILSLHQTTAAVKGCRFRGHHFQNPQTLLQDLDEEAEIGVRADVYVLHQPVGGLCGFGANLPLDELARPLAKMGVQYAALGDIHQYTYAECEGVKFSYPGSPERCSHDDTGPRSVNIVTVDADGVSVKPVLLNTREFVRVRADTDADVEALLQELDKFSETRPVMILLYKTSAKASAKRAEGLLKSRGLIYRMYPESDDGTVAGLVSAEFDRKQAPDLLRKAITAFFDENSDEAVLVRELLESPDPGTALDNYVKEALDEIEKDQAAQLQAAP